MYFYSRAGDTHNDISTTQSTVAEAIQINTFLGGILNCEVWGDLDYVSVLLNTYLNWN